MGTNALVVKRVHCRRKLNDILIEHDEANIQPCTLNTEDFILEIFIPLFFRIRGCEYLLDWNHLIGII